MKKIITLALMAVLLTSCTSIQSMVIPDLVPTEAPQTNIPNPASAFCEQQGYHVEIRTADDGSQAGYCIFPDGSECDEWAFFRNECEPAANQDQSTSSPTEIPTTRPVEPDEYVGWWTYTHPAYGFSLMLPEDWEVGETTSSDLLMNGHLLTLFSDGLNIRMTFRYPEEDVLLWPTGVGSGEFINQGTLNIAGQPAQRYSFVCPNGEINAIWYHDADGSANIQRGGMEFGFIFSLTNHYCESGYSLDSKTQHVGDMIVASLTFP